MSNRLAKIVAAIFVIMIAIFLMSSGAGSKPAPDRIGVSFMDKSKTIDISSDDSCYKDVVDSAIGLLSSANDKYKLLVSKNLIEELKRDEKGFLITFSRPEKIKVKKFDKEIFVSEIFIPLSGRFAEGRTTIFFADPEYQSGNQFVNTKDTVTRQKLEGCIQQD